MNQNVQYDFCPKCGALMRQGVCQSCEFTVNVNPVPKPEMNMGNGYNANPNPGMNMGNGYNANPNSGMNMGNPTYQNPGNNSYTPNPGVGMPQPKPQPPKKNNTGLIIGLVIGGVCVLLVLVIVAIIALYSIFNMAYASDKEEFFHTEEEEDEYLFDYDYDNYDEDSDLDVDPYIDMPSGDESLDDIWDDLGDSLDSMEKNLIDLDGDGVGDLEYESGVEGLNAEYYPLITDYIRYDLSYSVAFEEYENEEETVQCVFPVLEGEHKFIPYLNQFFFMFAEETESIADENQCSAISDAYVTYMDEDILSVVFIEVYSFADESTYECIYCYNIDMKNGEWLNFGLVDASDAVLDEMEKRCIEQSTSDAEYLFNGYSNDEIREFLANAEDSLVAFYTPLGMEIGLCYEGYWCCATFKDYENYLTIVEDEESTEF